MIGESGGFIKESGGFVSSATVAQPKAACDCKPNPHPGGWPALPQPYAVPWWAWALGGVLVGGALMRRRRAS